MSSSITLVALSLQLSSARAADYDGDGYDDLVVGVPGEDALDGAIEVIRGSAYGLTVTGDAFITQDTSGVTGGSSGAMFGAALGAGDVDGDHTTDLIVGAPCDPWSYGTGAAWRLELTESRRGSLSVTTSQPFSQSLGGVSGTAEVQDRFGSAIAVADFDGDGYDDVVVGVPSEDHGTIALAGGVQYLAGGPGGLDTSDAPFYDQDSTDMASTAEELDRFGDVLAAGDFDGDGYADLAVGVPGEDWYGTDEGAVHVVHGSSTGLDAVGREDRLWTAGVTIRGLTTVAGTLDSGNACGSSLAVGDFDDDGYDDLAVGCPGDDSPGDTRAGSVLILYGSSTGLDDSDVVSQATSGVYGTADEDDGFGWALASGHYDDDAYADLAIGVPGEGSSTGIVQVLMGSARAGLTGAGDLFVNQGTAYDEVIGQAETGDRFGTALTSGDYNGDGLDDLAVGSLYDGESGVEEAGAVNVFYGSASGPTESGDAMFHQHSRGIDDAAEEGDWFAYALR
jgi:hypothetical protein